MARRIELHHGEIDALCARLNTTIGQIQEDLENLESQLMRLRAGWDGDAQRAFDQAHIQWDAQMRYLRAIAKQLTALSAGTNEKFRNEDSANARVWQV